MAKPRAKFTQSDVTRAIKAIAKAGVTAARAEIEPSGKIVIVFGDRGAPDDVSPLDAWRAQHGSGKH